MERIGHATTVDSARDINNHMVVNQNIYKKRRLEPEKILFNLQRPETNFIGRSIELNRLHDFMELSPRSPSFPTKSHRIIVSGLGGVGKTQLVRKFVEKNQLSYYNIIWIDSASRESIRDSFKRLAADKFEISIHNDESEKHFNSIVESVFSKIGRERTLFIYDNVDKTDNIKFVLTMMTGDLDIIITSRIQEWDDEIEGFPLKIWEINEAIEYVSKTLKNANDSEDDKKLLVQKLQAFPLALRQATAHINYQRKIRVKFRIADYIAKYGTREMLDSKLFKKSILNEYQQTTYTTWEITIDAIKQDDEQEIGRLAIRILNIIAYFQPDHIKRDTFFHLAFDENNDKEKIEENVMLAVRLLVNYSMIDGREEQSILSIHRVVQKVIKLKLENTEDGATPTLRDGLILSSKLIECATIQETYQQPISVFLSSLKFNELVKEFSAIPSAIVKSFNKNGRYSRAKTFGDKLLQPLTSILSENHEDFLVYEFSMAQSYLLQRMFIESLDAYEKLLEKMVKYLGEDHPETLKCKLDIAYSLRRHGRYDEAIEKYKDVFEKQKNKIGEDAPDTIITSSCIAVLLKELHRYSEAFQVYQEVFEKQKTIFGEDNTMTLRTKTYIASLHNELGNHCEALEMHKEVLELRKNILEEDNLEVLVSKFHVACSHYEVGNHSEARQMHKEVSEQFINMLFKDPDIFNKNSYSEEGVHEEMSQIFQDVCEKERYMTM